MVDGLYNDMPQQVLLLSLWRGLEQVGFAPRLEIHSVIHMLRQRFSGDEMISCTIL